MSPKSNFEFGDMIFQTSPKKLELDYKISSEILLWFFIFKFHARIPGELKNCLSQIIWELWWLIIFWNHTKKLLMPCLEIPVNCQKKANLSLLGHS